MFTVRRSLPENYEVLALQTFFNLMMNGWVADKPTTGRAIFSRGYQGMQSRYATYGEGLDWNALDEWMESGFPSGHSVGTTTIWYKECLVWQMQYSGWYEARAIHTLKAALQENYAKNIWHGGRGPEQWSTTDGEFAYINSPSQIPFSRFFGTEFIGRKVPDLEQPKVVGIHHYRGGFMFQTPHDRHGH